MRVPVIALLALALSGCADVERFDAAGDVHALLISIRDEDQAGFDAHVDRTALKRQLRARLMTTAARRIGDGDPALASLGMALAGALVEVAADPLIQPEVFHAVADDLGYSADRPIPNQVVIANALRRIDDEQVCIPSKRDGPCLLVFRNEAQVWRLIGFEGDLDLLGPSHKAG
jgi:hypothetical protein